VNGVTFPEPKHRAPTDHPLANLPLTHRERRIARYLRVPCRGRHCAEHPVSSLPLEEV